MSITPWPYRSETLFSPLLGKACALAYGIRNLIHWLPVIWNDRNHHHTYLSVILRHKLADMERTLRAEGVSTNVDQRVLQMRACVALLDHLIEDDYDWSKGWDEAVQFKTRDVNDLFALMAEHYEDWWD